MELRRVLKNNKGTSGTLSYVDGWKLATSRRVEGFSPIHVKPPTQDFTSFEARRGSLEKKKRISHASLLHVAMSHEKKFEMGWEKGIFGVSKIRRCCVDFLKLIFKIARSETLSSGVTGKKRVFNFLRRRTVLFLFSQISYSKIRHKINFAFESTWPHRRLRRRLGSSFLCAHKPSCWRVLVDRLGQTRRGGASCGSWGVAASLRCESMACCSLKCGDRGSSNCWNGKIKKSKF